MSNPWKEHWLVVKHILKYLKGTADIELVYHGDMAYALTHYSNFDYDADLNARRTMVRYAFTVDNSHHTSTHDV